MPGQPGVIRARSETAVISANTSPAPPIAKQPRCTRWKSPGMPPGSAEYMFIGETTTRFATTICPTRNGVNIGGGGLSSGISKPCARTVAGKPALHVVDKFRVAHAQVLVGHRLGARQHAEARLDRLHAPVARRVLGPQRADVRRVLRLLDVLAPRALETLERAGDRPVASKAL